MYLVNHYCLYEFFHPVIDDQKLESICVPCYILNEVDIETDCILIEISIVKEAVDVLEPYPTLSFAC